MELKITLVTAIIFIGFLISFGIALYSHIKGYLKGQYKFTLMMMSAAIYAFGAMIESAAVTIDSKVFWSKVEYLGVSCATTFLLMFVLNLVSTGSNPITRRIRLLYIVPVTIIALAWTNEYHHLIWKSFEWSADGNNVLFYHHALIYYFFVVYSLGTIIISIYILLKALPQLPGIIKKQIKILILGCLAPVILTILYLFDISPISGLDLTVMSLPIMGSIFLIGIFRFGMFKIIPSVSSQITNVIQDGLVVMDEEGEIVFLNPSASSLLGLKEREFSFQSIREAPWLSEIATSGANGVQETAVMVNADPEKWLEITMHQINNDYREFKGNLILMHDITKRKRLESQSNSLLEELNISHEQMQEANRQKDRIMSIIAHDLRNTFHQVINLAGLMKEMIHDLTPEQLSDYLNDLVNASQQGHEILEDLLSWAKNRNEIKSPDKINVLDSINQIINSMTLSLQEKDISIEVKGDKELIINNDQNVLNMVVRNLLVNAVKFSNRSSIVTISIATTETDDLISISDNGIGIPESDLPKLFNAKTRYSRTGTGGESGTGLGLLLCKEMIERNNGIIEVVSQEGIGSTFTIRFHKSKKGTV